MMMPFEVVIPGPNGEPYHVYECEVNEEGGYWSKMWDHWCFKAGPFESYESAEEATKTKLLGPKSNRLEPSHPKVQERIGALMRLANQSRQSSPTKRTAELHPNVARVLATKDEFVDWVETLPEDCAARVQVLAKDEEGLYHEVSLNSLVDPGPDALDRERLRADKNASAVDAAHAEIDRLREALSECIATADILGDAARPDPIALLQDVRSTARAALEASDDE